MARRHKLDIIAEILTLSLSGTKKTRLVYLANPNFTILRKYLKLLEEKGFVYTRDNMIYTSQEGAEFLKQYEELMIAWDMVEQKTSYSDIRNNRVVVTEEDWNNSTVNLFHHFLVGPMGYYQFRQLISLF